MRLADFSVNNFRSITTARKIQTSNMTVLIGKNNEGKSNILRALTLAMDIMKIYCSDPRSFQIAVRSYLRSHYLWEKDYPVSLQERNPNGLSSVDFNFELDDRDIAAIRGLTGIRLSGCIPVRVSTNGIVAKVDIPKRGTPAFSDVENKKRIIEYICFKIDFNFIPAVRTEQHAMKVVNKLIERSLEALESNREYLDATQKIECLQQEVLDGIANQIVTPLQQFLPNVKNVQLQVQREKRRAALRSNTEIIIDDGTPTSIQQKGDGVKSLTALAMLNSSARPDKISVVAIEEPESHLHPESARQLYNTIMHLSETHQVVLTTHSPLFVNRARLCENIIVDGGKATPVKRIKEIRDVLGTQVADNLINAETVLVVEGETDKIALEKLLPNMSETIKAATQNGTFIIDHIGGSGKLSYHLGLYRGMQCKCHVFLDNDSAGQTAFKQAETNNLLDLKETTFAVCIGSSESEIEDCYSKEVYEHAIFEKYGVSLNHRAFKTNKKWSDRMRDCFREDGKIWDASIEKQVKISVANLVPSDATVALNDHKRQPIDALVRSLENLLSH